LSNSLSKRFCDVNLGGIICLRLVNPALVSPHKFIPNLRITSESQRTLILMAKVFQRLANGTLFGDIEAYMKPTNRFIQKMLPKWNSFFYQLLTGRNLEYLVSEIGYLDLDELVSRSNMELDPEHEPLLLKQAENMRFIFDIERHATWKPYQNKIYKCFF